MGNEEYAEYFACYYNRKPEMNRLLLGFVLVTCLLVLCTYHAAYHGLYEEYPGTEEVINGVEGTVSVYGMVLGTDGGEAFTVRLTYGSARWIQN